MAFKFNLNMFAFLKRVFGIKPNNPKPKHDIIFIENLINQLEESAYFRYANPNHIPQIKAELTDSISVYGVLGTDYDDQTFQPKCLRLFHLDGEDLYEQDGFREQFKFMKPYFDSIGLQLDFSQYYEVYEQGLTHWFVLNGTKYEVFNNFDDYGWEEAAVAFASILNEQLELQNKEDRAYLIDGGNDGQIIMATKEQIQILKGYLNMEYMPKLPHEWWKEETFILPFTSAE